MKPMILTEAQIEEMVRKFSETMRGYKNTSTSDITYKIKLDDVIQKEDNIAKPYVHFTPEAYIKMMTLVHKYDTEVGWHGTCYKDDEGDYVIEDIIVYPQEVAAATVNTDQEEYQKWLIDLDDDTMNTLHFHGHSHVNMGVSPSGVDIAHRDGIASSIPKNGFYIFLIVNKKRDMNFTIYDREKNTIFESKDVKMDILSDFCDPLAILDEAKDKVKAKTYSYHGPLAAENGVPKYKWTPGGYIENEEYPKEVKPTKKKKKHQTDYSDYEDMYLTYQKLEDLL